MIYFDNAATSFERPAVVARAVERAVRTFGSPSRGAHGPSLLADRTMEETRQCLSDLFGAGGPQQIAFTMNATQALNTALFGIGLKKGDHLITSVLDHNSVLRPSYRLRDQGIKLHIIGADRNGNLMTGDLKKLLAELAEENAERERPGRERRIAVALTHASNVTGNVTDIGKIGRMCRRAGAVFIADAAQTAGILPIDMQKMHIDILCFSGHKALMGPQGTGGIAVWPGLALSPLMEGGSGVFTFLQHMPEYMPAQLEAGTQNAQSIAGLLAALKASDGKYEERFRRERDLTLYFLKGLNALNRESTEGKPPVRIYGEPEKDLHLPTVAFNLQEEDSAEIADLLWRKYGIAVRAGGHCAPLMHRHFGTEDRGMVRVSFSGYNTKKQIDVLLRAIRIFLKNN
jgi:cysteine desulfurase family protein